MSTLDNSSRTYLDQPRKAVRPPVKVACTSCRASRIRCDGNSVCNSCLIRGKECQYLKSNRGGPRISRKKARISEKLHAREMSHQNQDNLLPIDWQAIELPPEEVYSELVASMIEPGAGLIDLESDNGSDEIFDSIFAEWQTATPTMDVSGNSPDPSPPQPLVRHYNDIKSILNAYYIFIHPYFPIMPPTNISLEVDNPDSESNVGVNVSPLVTALLAILTLIPHPDDRNPSGLDSTLLRRERANAYAQQTMIILETEIELIESAVAPSEALRFPQPVVNRTNIHPHLPLQLESVLAYLLMSIYEYAQRGNLAKMRNRACQAYDAAVRLSLHDISDMPLDKYTQARRRAWWMTVGSLLAEVFNPDNQPQYTVMLQSSIVSNIPPINSIELEQFKTPLPVILGDLDAWPLFLDAQLCILKCTQYTVALKKNLEAGQDPSSLTAKLTELDLEIDSVISRFPQDPRVTSHSMNTCLAEEDVAKSLRLQALIKLNSGKIKLHRYLAFLDIPIFTRRHCDLQQTGPDFMQNVGCSCHSTSLEVGSKVSLESRGGVNWPNQRLHSPPEKQPNASPSLLQEIPFNDMAAAKVCLKAALAIGRAFESLPYPNPMQKPILTRVPTFLSNNSLTQAPRTMPAFACCAMQSCYALLTILHRSREIQHPEHRTLAADSGLVELQTGVERILSALGNYAIAFEALCGMTGTSSLLNEILDTETRLDQIGEALQSM